MKILILPLCLLLVFPLLGSCGITAPDRQVFPLCMAIDVSRDNRFVLTVQCPRGTGAQEEPAGDSQGADGYAEYSAASGNLSQALHLLEAALPFPLHFGQLRLCFVSAQALEKESLGALALALLRFPSIRASATLLVVRGSAGEALLAQRATFSMRLSAHMDTLLQSLASRGYVPQSSLASVLQDLGSRRRDPLLGLGAVNPRLQPRQEGGGEGEAEVFSGSAPVLEDTDIAGGILLKGDDPLEIMGAAVVARERVVGTLTPRECVVFHHLRTKGRLGCAIREDSLQLQIRLAPADLNDTLLREGRQLVQKLQALGSDPLGFSNVSAHSFWTDGEWEAYRFGERYPQADVYIGP